MNNQVNREKRYYLKDIIKMLHISRKTYYIWEQRKKVFPAKRDPMSGYRYWTEEDAGWLLRFIGYWTEKEIQEMLQALRGQAADI